MTDKIILRKYLQKDMEIYIDKKWIPSKLLNYDDFLVEFVNKVDGSISVIAIDQLIFRVK